MAYVSKEKKAKIVAAVKAAKLPKEWKITFAVDNHTSIVATIRQAPASVLDDYLGELHSDGMPHVNEYHLDKLYKGKTLAALTKLLAALNTDNFDHSDSQSDYFHVGHYVDISFGRWDKPCTFVGKRRKAKAAEPVEQVEAVCVPEPVVETVPASTVVPFPTIVRERSPEEIREIAKTELIRRAVVAMKETPYGAMLTEEVMQSLATVSLGAMLD